MFAKLYGTDVDQVLVKLAAGEDGNPEVRMYCQPEGLGVCSVAAGWDDDSDASWDKAEKAFAEIDEFKAREWAQALYRQLGVSMPNTGLTMAGRKDCRYENR